MSITRFRTRSRIVFDKMGEMDYIEVPRYTDMVLAKDYDEAANKLALYEAGCIVPRAPRPVDWYADQERYKHAQQTASDALGREHKALEKVRELEDRIRKYETPPYSRREELLDRIKKLETALTDLEKKSEQQKQDISFLQEQLRHTARVSNQRYNDIFELKKNLKDLIS